MSKIKSSITEKIKESKTPSKNNDDQSGGSTTNHDSLLNTKKSKLKSYKTEKKINEKEKKNNFFMALKTLTISVDINNESNFAQGINEYSETNPNQTKEENISKYIHRPLVKEIIKDGNNLNTIKPLKQFGISINNPYAFNYNLGDIIYKFKTIKTEKNADNKIHVNKNSNFNTTVVNSDKFKKFFNTQINNKKINDNLITLNAKKDKNIKCKKHNNFSTNIKPLHMNKIIADLEKPEEIKMKDYENKINIIKKNQKFDKINLNKNNNNNKNQTKKDNLKGVVKTLNFKDIPNNEKNEENINYNNNTKKENKNVPKIKGVLFSTKNTATGEKIRKKYQRSEFKKNRMLLNSANINNKNLINFIINENKENLSNNDKIELTKKIIKKINEMTTIKVEYNDNNNEINDINNNILYNFYKRKDNFYCNSKNVAKNLINMFNSCSKNINFDDSSLINKNESIKNINNSSFQEMMDLFSNNNENEKKVNDNQTIVIKNEQNKINFEKDFNSLFESSSISKNKNTNNNLFINDSLKKEIFFNDFSSKQFSNKISSTISLQKTNPNKNDKNDNNILIEYSPINQKIRKFDINSPFNNSLFSNEYTIADLPQIFNTDIQLKQYQKSHDNLINIFSNNKYHKGFVELTENPSLALTQGANSFNKVFYKKIEPNKNINVTDINSASKEILFISELYSKNKSYSIISDESQMPNTIYDISFYLNLINQSNSFPKINPKIIFQKNNTIKWEDRLKILLWMNKNCEEFAYKRDTFHYSIFYFDLFLFLSKEEIKKEDLKLIGITCISLSAKIEEIQIPKLIEYAKSIEPNYTDINSIIMMEQKICSTLKWKLIPITIEIWLNWYTCQWDLYLDSSPEIKKQLIVYIKEDDIIYFKKQTEQAYSNYRRIYQLIDLISMDYNNYNYDKRQIVAGCFLECIAHEYKLEYSFIKKKLYSKNKEVKQEFIDIIQNIFNLFLEQSFDYSFNDDLIQKCIKYVFTFKHFSFSYNMPLVYRAGEKKDEDINNNYEDFISYQTTNSNIYSFFEKMYKKDEKKDNKNIKKKRKDIRK